MTNEEAAAVAVTGASREQTVTPANPSPPSNFSSLGATPPTSVAWAAMPASGPAHLFAPATSGLEHEGAGTEQVDPISGTRSTDGPYTTSPNSDHPSSGEAAEGETPDWVPADAMIYIDLVGGTPQGRAWVAGTGEVAVDTLLGSDPNTEAGWGETGYNPANLTANGYFDSDGAAISLIGLALTKVINAFTVRIQTREGDTEFFGGGLVLLSADGNDAIELGYMREPAAVEVQSWSADSLHLTISPITNFGLEEALNGIAMTIDGSRCDLAANGSSPVTGMISALDRPSGNPLVACVINSTDEIQSVTLYDPLPSTAGLSELSEVT